MKITLKTYKETEKETDIGIDDFSAKKKLNKINEFTIIIPFTLYNKSVVESTLYSPISLEAYRTIEEGFITDYRIINDFIFIDAMSHEYISLDKRLHRTSDGSSYEWEESPSEYITEYKDTDIGTILEDILGNTKWRSDLDRQWLYGYFGYGEGEYSDSTINLSILGRYWTKLDWIKALANNYYYIINNENLKTADWKTNNQTRTVTLKKMLGKNKGKLKTVQNIKYTKNIDLISRVVSTGSINEKRIETTTQEDELIKNEIIREKAIVNNNISSKNSLKAKSNIELSKLNTSIITAEVEISTEEYLKKSLEPGDHVTAKHKDQDIHLENYRIRLAKVEPKITTLTLEPGNETSNLEIENLEKDLFETKIQALDNSLSTWSF